MNRKHNSIEKSLTLLGDLENSGKIEIGRGDVISKIDIKNNPGSYPIYSSSALNNGEMGKYSKYMFDEEIITWSIDGGGKFFYKKPHKFSVTNVCGYIKRKNDQIDLNFLFEILNFQYQNLTFDYQFKAHPSVIKSIYTFPKVSIEQQQKFSHYLSSLDKVIFKTDSILTKLRDLRKSLTNKLLKKKNNWKTCAVSKIVNKDDKHAFSGGPFGSNLKTEDYTEKGIRIIQLQNIGDGSFMDNNKIYTSKKKADELLSSNIYPGEIIISKMGDPVGRACIIPNTHNRYLMASDGIRLSIDKKNFDTFFILNTINHYNFRDNVNKKSIGSTRKRISLVELRKLNISYPELKDQKKISKILSSLDNTIEKKRQKLNKIIFLKRSIAQDIVNNKISV